MLGSMLGAALAVMAGNVKIAGTILDAKDGEALVGATVRAVQDTVQAAGTTTDGNGKFVLNFDSDAAACVLECSYVGYETLRMEVQAGKSVSLGEIRMQEAATAIGEVVVEGDAVIRKVDRQVLLPSKEQVQAASNGVTLLKNLQLPRIVVNPVDNSIKTLMDEGVQLRINGIESTIAEVTAIDPKDVIRIEYHDHPGVRYGGAAAVLDYIVKHRDTGGSLMLDASNGVTTAGWGEYFLAGKLHFGKSSLSLIGQYSPRDLYWTRTNAETYNFTASTVESQESGEPTRYKTNPANIGLTYNRTNGDKNMLNITLRDNMDYTPYAESNRESHLLQGTDSFSVRDHQSSTMQSPSIDIYYQHNLPKQQAVYIDVVGTYINSGTERRFEQTPLAESAADTTNVFSAVRGDKFSLIGEAIYEKAWENVMLTAGVKHTQQWMKNRYLSETEETSVVSMTTAETYAFAEVQQRVGNFAYAAGVGAMHTFIRQGGYEQSKWIARPELTLCYDFGKGVFWQYKAYVSGYQPSLSALNDVDQQIDKYQIRRGNPELKAVMFVSNNMQLSWQSKYVGLNVYANYSYDHRPIMDESFEEDGMIIRTSANQRGFHRLQVSPSVQVRLLNNQLTFTVAPFANYYVSLGNAYTHRHFNPGVRASVMGMYKGWQFFADVTTRRNNLWGETLEYGEFIHSIGIGYNSDRWGFRATMLEPFSTKGYSRSTQDLSAIAPNTQLAVMQDMKQMLVLNFHMNLDFGTARNEQEKRINNEDTDTGILSSTK